MITAKKEPTLKLKERMLFVLKRTEFSALEELYYYKQFLNTPVLIENALSYCKNGNYWTGLIVAEDDRTENLLIMMVQMKSSSKNPKL